MNLNKFLNLSKFSIVSIFVLLGAILFTFVKKNDLSKGYSQLLDTETVNADRNTGTAGTGTSIGSGGDDSGTGGSGGSGTDDSQN